MKYLHICLGAFLLLTTASLSLAEDLVNINEFPEWVQNEMAKEKKLKKKTKLVYEPLGINKKIKGALISEQDFDTTRYYEIGIGSGVPVECYIFREFDGPANSLKNVLKAGMEASAEGNQRAISDSFNYAVDVGVIDTAPFLSVESLYYLGEGDNKLIGLVKGLTAKVSNVLPMCIHNELGYRKTFRSVAESFVEAVASAYTSDAFYELVYMLEVNGMPVGFGQEAYKLDADGDIEAYMGSSSAVPADARSISSSDSVIRSWSSANGELINSHAESIENGAYAFAYSLTYRDGAWVADGESQGKAQTYTLEHKDALTSNHGSYLDVLKLLDTEKEKSRDYVTWMPDVDPSRVINVNVSKIESDKKHNLEYLMGPIKVKAMVDKHGITSSGLMMHGPVSVKITTLFSKGKPAKIGKKIGK